MAPMDRDHFAAAFQDAATQGLAAGRVAFEQLYVEEIREGDGDDLYAVALVSHGDRLFRYRKRFWPTDQAVDLAAAMYVTGLEERLLTGRLPDAPAEPGAREELR